MSLEIAAPIISSPPALVCK